MDVEIEISLRDFPFYLPFPFQWVLADLNAVVVLPIRVVALPVLSVKICVKLEYPPTRKV